MTPKNDPAMVKAIQTLVGIPSFAMPANQVGINS